MGRRREALRREIGVGAYEKAVSNALELCEQPPLWFSRNFFLEMEADVISTRMMRRACVGGRTRKKAKNR